MQGRTCPRISAIPCYCGLMSCSLGRAEAAAARGFDDEDITRTQPRGPIQEGPFHPLDHCAEITKPLTYLERTADDLLEDIAPVQYWT